MSDPTFDQFVAVRQVGSPTYSPRGDRFAYLSNATGLPALWSQPDRGGFARQLTSLTDLRVQRFAWSPDGSRIAFVADRHGDEMNQVFIVAGDGGWPKQLTNEPTVQFQLAGWTPDGENLVVSGNDREPTQVDTMLLDPESGEIDRLVTGGQFYAGDVSPDGKSLVIVEFLSNTRQRIWLYDLNSREKRSIFGVPEGDEETSISARPLQWRGDSSGFYAVTDLDSEFTRLVFIARDGGSWRTVPIAVGDDGGEPAAGQGVEVGAEVVGAVLNEERTRMLALVNRRGLFEAHIFSLEGVDEGALPAPALPLGVPAGVSFHPAGERLVMAYDTPGQATNLLEFNLTTGEERPLEQSMLGGIDPEVMIAPASIDYPTFDREIHAWLYRPRGDGPFPVVVSIHGGPEGQELAGYAYQGLYQYLLSRGIGVLAPNIRGSTGYGKAYQKLIYRDWGGGELRDIEAAADYLGGLDWVDPQRLAIFGGSFGGFATLSALTRLPDRWAAGVDLVGPSNLITFVGSVPPFWLEMMEAWVGHPERDEALLKERSPITYVDDLVAPLLVIQGQNDPRVVKAESDQFVERLRERGVEVTYHVDETAGHGPPGRDGWVEWLRLTVDFLERHLLGEVESTE